MIYVVGIAALAAFSVAVFFLGTSLLFREALMKARHGMRRLNSAALSDRQKERRARWAAYMLFRYSMAMTGRLLVAGIPAALILAISATLKLASISDVETAFGTPPMMVISMVLPASMAFLK